MYSTVPTFPEDISRRRDGQAQDSKEGAEEGKAQGDGIV